MQELITTEEMVLRLDGEAPVPDPLGQAPGSDLPEMSQRARTGP